MERQLILAENLLGKAHSKGAVLVLIGQLLYNSDIKIYNWEFYKAPDRCIFNLGIDAGYGLVDYSLSFDGVFLPFEGESDIWEYWDKNKARAERCVNGILFDPHLSEGTMYRFLERKGSLYLAAVGEETTKIVVSEEPSVPDMKVFLDLV